MNRLDSPVQLLGNLEVKLDQFLIQIRCKGSEIELNFPSFKALWHFAQFNRAMKRSLTPLHPFYTHVNALNWTYYIQNDRIGESAPFLKPSWIGRYFGIARSKIYLSHLFRNFFR